MKEPVESDIENLLRSVAPAPAPPGLRVEILEAAAVDKARQAMSPFVRACFATCGAFLIVVGIADWALGRAENVRLAAFVVPELRTESVLSAGKVSDDIFAGLPLMTKKLMTRPGIRFRPGPRSWDPLKEDFDGGQSSENLN